jgi:hypothetical protein
MVAVDFIRCYTPLRSRQRRPANVRCRDRRSTAPGRHLTSASTASDDAVRPSSPGRVRPTTGRSTSARRSTTIKLITLALIGHFRKLMPNSKFASKIGVFAVAFACASTVFAEGQIPSVDMNGVAFPVALCNEHPFPSEITGSLQFQVCCIKL